MRGLPHGLWLTTRFTVALGTAPTADPSPLNSGVEEPRPCARTWCSVVFGEACRSMRPALRGAVRMQWVRDSGSA